jgi:hypothetical protein
MGKLKLSPRQLMQIPWEIGWALPSLMVLSHQAQTIREESLLG